MPTEAAVIDPVIDPKEKAIFTPEQQELLNQIVQKRIDRHGKDLKTEIDTLTADKKKLETELAVAKDTLASAAKGSAESSEAAVTVESLKNELEEVKRSSKTILLEKEEMKKQLETKEKGVLDVQNQMLELRKQTEMQFAAQRLPFVDMEAVIVLTQKFIKYDKDTDSFTVVNEKGAPRFNPVGDPYTLDEFYNEFAQQKKHLVRSDAIAGLGTAESNRSGLPNKGFKIEDIFGPKADARKAMTLKKSDPAKYDTMRKEAVALGWLR